MNHNKLQFINRKDGILVSSKAPVTLIRFSTLHAEGVVEVQITHILQGKLTLNVTIQYDDGTSDYPLLFDDGTITYLTEPNEAMQKAVRAAFDWLHDLFLRHGNATRSNTH